MKAETIRQRKKFALELAERGDRIPAKSVPRRGRNSPPPDVIPQPKGSGLALWRQRLAEDKKERMEELERLRVDAVTVERDGREFRLVRIPDRYEWKRDAA